MPDSKPDLSLIKDVIYLIGIVIVVILWLIKAPEEKFSTKTEFESLGRELREHKEMAREHWNQNSVELRSIRTAISETKDLLISMDKDG